MKAKLTENYIKTHHENVAFHCPQIANSPKQAIKQLEEIIATYPKDKWHLIGSSLGGYFSTYFSEKYQLPAVLVNPAVMPYSLLADYIGEQTNPYTGEVYQVSSEHMSDLKRLEQQEIDQKNYQVMVQTGDEVLDYRQAVQKYAQSQLIVQEGGDHSFLNFEKMLPNIVNFLQLT